MKVYIRFEDTYGLCDFYSVCKQVDVTNNLDTLRLNDNLWIRKSLGIRGIFNIQRKELQLINTEQIDVVICVLDLDNYDGNKTTLLDKSSICEHLRVLEENINVIRPCKVLFMPVTYAAETLMLYVLYDCKLNPIEVVSNENTNELHYLLVRRKLVQLRNEGRLSTRKLDPKKVKLMLTDFDVKVELQKELNKQRGNEIILQWLLSTSMIAVELCLDCEEFIEYLESVLIKFEKFVRMNRSSINIGDEVVQICDLKRLAIDIESQLK